MKIDVEKMNMTFDNIVENFLNECNSFSINDSNNGYFIMNGSFESIDSEMLYSMIRTLLPNNIIEVGSGYSTWLTSTAIKKNFENTKTECDFLTIDPVHWYDFIKNLDNVSFKLTDVQNVNLELFNKLKENDILFIDSSHTLDKYGDVRLLYSKIIPNLNKGVYVHIHDIFYPNDYPAHWDWHNWNEQYLLESFLEFNDTFEIILAMNYIKTNSPEKLKVYNSYNDNVQPGSFWIKKIK